MKLIHFSLLLREREENKTPNISYLRNRSPDQADKYYPEWTSKNLDRNQYAESERLAAERLLEETLDLLKETKIRTKQVGLNRTRHLISLTGHDRQILSGMDF